MSRLVFAAWLVACATALSCKVNDYCLNCETGDGGTDGDGGGGDDDGGDGGGCVPTGIEVCDDQDNDCDRAVDEGVLPDVGAPCGNQVGECAGSVSRCTGGAIVCSINPAPEQCDGKDNDCNGLADEGDPGGGGRCGTDLGECVAGVLHCNLTTHVVECQGRIDGSAEGCNGRDDDCDGRFDEGLTNLGACGSSDVGECAFGVNSCVGGGVVCVGAVGPTFEQCDALDQDCDGEPRNGFDLDGDPQNCGACGRVCALDHAIAGCGGTPPDCTVASCQSGFHDNNELAADGCEFGPCQIQGNEVCNGADDDCSGAADDGVVVPPGLCLTTGACAGATASCQGADGFRCSYGAGVSQDAGGNIVAETRCDGIDNDCDGAVDEGQPNLDDPCSDSGLGVCQGTGRFECDPADLDGPARCVITAQGGSASAEVCDGKDNDCDGIADDGAETGGLPGQDWVTIPGLTPAVEIQKWEASRPDASASAGGTIEAAVCSRQGVQPWTNLKYPQAVAACDSIGARLCTEDEWQAMCSQPPAVSYPVTGPTGLTDHVFIEAEQAQALVARSGGNPNEQRSWQPDTTSNFSGSGALIALPNTMNDGSQISANNAPNQSPRMEFQVDFPQTGAHFVWVRLYSQDSDDNSVYVGINTSASATPSGTTLAPNQNQFWQWVRSSSINVTSGTRFVSVFMRRDGVRVDAISISRDGTNPPPIDNSIWAYQSDPKLAQPQVCNGNELDTDPVAAGDQDAILATGSLAACFANGAGGADVFDMSGNVKEWTLARSPGQNPIRGGSANNDVNGLACELAFTLADDTFFFPNVGFRCCR